MTEHTFFHSCHETCHFEFTSHHVYMRLFATESLEISGFPLKKKTVRQKRVNTCVRSWESALARGRQGLTHVFVSEQIGISVGCSVLCSLLCTGVLFSCSLCFLACGLSHILTGAGMRACICRTQLSCSFSQPLLLSFSHSSPGDLVVWRVPYLCPHPLATVWWMRRIWHNVIGKPTAGMHSIALAGRALGTVSFSHIFSFFLFFICLFTLHSSAPVHPTTICNTLREMRHTIIRFSLGTKSRDFF